MASRTMDRVRQHYVIEWKLADRLRHLRTSRPHDVSQGFDEVATGFHLREYTGREIRVLLLEAGFPRMDFYAGGRGGYVRMLTALALLAESLFDRVPKTICTHIPIPTA